MNEKRRHPRADVAVLVQIRYAASDPPRTVYATNISAGGLFLEVDDGKPLGTRVFVQVTTPDGNALLRGEGRVARLPGPDGDKGVGIELVGFDDEAKKVLARLVDQSARGN